MAVGLLREGIREGRDSFEADTGDGEILKDQVRLKLANALLNLAYAWVALKQDGKAGEVSKNKINKITALY